MDKNWIVTPLNYFRYFFKTIISSWSTVCFLCKTYYQGPHAICASCFALFRRIEYACTICSLPLLNADYSLCGQCIAKKPFFDKVYTAYYYQEPLRRIFHHFKYYEAFYLQSILIQLMQEALKTFNHRPDCLIPVPMHHQRLKDRGFNQSAILTKNIARYLRLPYHLSLCKKVKNTVPQASLDKRKRKKNLQHSFTVAPNSYQHIVIVDDLLTTGNTVNEVAKMLKKQGVKRVDIICCARTA